MNVLSIRDLEKHEKDVLLFSAFHFDLASSEVAAIHSSLNIRVALLNMLLGKVPISNGSILVSGENITQHERLHEKQIGICFFDQGLYDRLTVMDHIKFFKQLYASELDMDQVLQLTQLGTLRSKKVNKLTYSEKRRVHFAQLLLKNPTLFIFEEPDLNVDVETKRVFLNILEHLKREQKGVLVLTGIMESAITIADSVYRLNEDGIHKIEMEDEKDNESEPKVVEQEEAIPTAFNFNKVPTKVNEKIILFDPPEIDYIESNDGQSHVYIKGESFPSVFTLNELEDRLKPYGFFRCHRSYIVNLQKVREVITWTRNSYSLVLDDKPKSTIPLSKTKMTQLKEMLGLK
jgi:ABC-2 type transport system ATP-binding protein